MGNDSERLQVLIINKVTLWKYILPILSTVRILWKSSEQPCPGPTFYYSENVLYLCCPAVVVTSNLCGYWAPEIWLVGLKVIQTLLDANLNSHTWLEATILGRCYYTRQKKENISSLIKKKMESSKSLPCNPLHILRTEKELGPLLP